MEPPARSPCRSWLPSNRPEHGFAARGAFGFARFLFWRLCTRRRWHLSIFQSACVWCSMSASQAVFSGWMEIPGSTVSNEARLRAEEETLAALVSQYSGTLYRVAFSVLRNPSDAEDAVQEAFMRVLRHRDTLGEVRDQRVWLIRIVWNIVLDRKRRAKTRPETDDVSELARVLPSGGLSAEQIAVAAQHHAHVLACVDKLPAKEREVLMLSAFDELNSVEKIGRAHV